MELIPFSFFEALWSNGWVTPRLLVIALWGITPRRKNGYVSFVLLTPESAPYKGLFVYCLTQIWQKETCVSSLFGLKLLTVNSL
jgi:hypothetical protein